MAAYETLRAAIDSYIKANGNNEITGEILNDILNAMVSALGADTRFAGVAVPSTNPGNPEGNVVYFASQAGTYSNFGGIVLQLGIHILVWNGTTWTSQTWFSVDNTPTQSSQNLATSGGIFQAIVDAVGVERLRAIGAEVTSCSFNSTTKKVSFFNSANSTLFQLDATAFIIDGMVRDVKIEDGNLVIQFNTDAGKQDIEIPLTEIFDPANYYTKTAIDALLALYYTKTETNALLTAINNKLADGCLYRGMAEPSTNPPTPTTKVFYIATKAGTYTNFGNIAVTDGITILKYDGSNWSKEQISYSDGVFDISAYNGTSYADLSSALGTNGANIPQNLRKGGMSVKFVQSSDNKYVQYRLMAQNFTTDTTQWQGVDEEPTAGSENLVKSGGVADNIQILAQNTVGDIFTTLYRGNINNGTGKKTTNVTTRITNLYPIKDFKALNIKCTGNVVILGIKAYNNETDINTGGVKDTDWYNVYSATPPYNTKEYTVQYNSNFPNIYVTFAKSDITEELTLEYANANITFYNIGSLDDRIAKLEDKDAFPTFGSRKLVESGGVVYSLCELLAWQLKVGGISTDGSNSDSKERIRTENWLELPIGSIIELSGSVDGQITVYEYNAYGSYEKVTKSDSWNVKQITTSAKWIRFVFMYLDSRVCTNTDAQIVKNSIKIIKKDDILTNAKVDNNSADIYMLPSNLKSNMEVGNIAMSDSGWTYTDSTTRVRTKENYVLNLPKGVTVKATEGLRFALNYKYIDRGVTKYALSYWQSEFLIPVDCECVFIMEVTNNVDYAFNNIHINKTDGIGEKVVDIEKKVETLLPQFGNVEYFGKRLTLESLKREKNFCDITKLHQVLWIEDEEPMSITTNKLVDLQSSALYNNFVFNFLDGGNCYVIKLDTYEYVGIFSTGLSGWHMNNAQFSNIFYEPTDDYPLLLVSNGGELNQETNGSCAYLRIQESNGTFTFTKVMDIQTTFDKSRHIGTFVADWYTKKLWLYCYEQSWSPNTIYNPIYFVEYELPEFVNGGNITLENSAIIRTTIYPMYYAYIQGGITFNGKILIGTRCDKPSSGLTNEENEATNEDYVNAGDMFFVLDQGTLSLETFIPVKDPANHEIEGISLYEDKIYLTERSGGRTNDYHTTTHTKQIYTLLKYEFS